MKSQSLLAEEILYARARYLAFLKTCRSAGGGIGLTPMADASPYAACFWIYGMHLLQEKSILNESGASLAVEIRQAVRDYRKRCTPPQVRGKQYRQLLAFSLSALSILGLLANDPLEDLVVEQLPDNLDLELHTHGCLAGKPQSGNQAMFVVIFLLHARDLLGMPLDAQISYWVQSHLSHLNSFGFWGRARNMTALQFQNGYHQYEIFEYLGIYTGREEAAVASVSALADSLGHFAPYPGGGGCFDYDAVFMLTPGGQLPDMATSLLLKQTLHTLLQEQRPDGGFCESLYVRPRELCNLVAWVSHVARAIPNIALFAERLKYAIVLQRTKHDRIATHWSRYSRRWDESDLWDSWFRMLAIARIQCAFSPGYSGSWGFIDFPGIGFHPSLRGIDLVRS